MSNYLFDADPEMAITAIAPWFGGKRNLAPAIIQELGPHRSYWEPFCGSMAVLLAKPVASMETVNDLHGDLVNLARVVQREDLAIDLYGRLARTLMHEELMHAAASRCRSRGNAPACEEPDTDRAYDYMLCAWMGRNGVAGTQSYNQGFCVRYTQNGGHSAKRWVSAVESIPAWHQRLRAVTILNRDGFRLIERIEDSPNTVVYCDPPYVEKGAKYVHDFACGDHERLATLLQRFRRARVIVSYYEHESLLSLYPGWTFVPLAAKKSLGLGSNGRAAKAPEILIINGPSAGVAP